MGILDLQHLVDVFKNYILVTVLNFYAATLTSKLLLFVCYFLNLILFSSFFAT